MLGFANAHLVLLQETRCNYRGKNTSVQNRLFTSDPVSPGNTSNMCKAVYELEF